MKISHQVLFVLFVLTALAALASPRPAAAYDKSAFVAPQGEALVVFIQNLRADRSMSYIVFDPEKECVAEVGGRQAEVVPMKPGKHTLYVTGYNTHRIELDLVAGRTYFIRLHSVEKFATRISNVTPVQRGTDSYRQVKTWLYGARVSHASEDPCRGKPLKERQNRTQRRINEADADWKTGDELYRMRYTLIRIDGLTATEIDTL